MTRISDIFYGDNTTKLILKKEWLPSTGLYPTDTTEGIVYIAADDGSVSGESFSEDDLIIYKDSEWVAVGSGGSGGAGVVVSDTAPTSPTEGTLWWDSTDPVNGALYIWFVGEAPTVPSWLPVSNGIEKWTPTASPQPVVFDKNDFNPAFSSNPNLGSIINRVGDEITITAGPTGTEGVYAETSNAIFEVLGQANCLCYQLNDINDDFSIYYDLDFYAISNLGHPSEEASFPLISLKKAENTNDWYYYDGTVGTNASGPYTTADILSHEVLIGTDVINSTTVTFVLYINGTLSYTSPSVDVSSALGITLPYNQLKLYLIIQGGFGAEFDSFSLTQRIVPNTPVAGVTVLQSDIGVDESSYPNNREDKPYQVVNFAPKSAPVDSALGNVFDGVIWTFDGSGNPSTTTH